MSSTWLKNLKKIFGQELLDFGQPNLIQCLSDRQVDKKIFLLRYSVIIQFCFCWSLIYMLPLWLNNKLLYFWKNYVFQPVIHTIFWDHDTSHSVVFYEIILWRHTCRSCFIFYMLQMRPVEWKEKTQNNRKKYSEYIYRCIIICLKICAW